MTTTTTTTTINPDAFITEWVHTTGNFTLPLRSGFTYNMMVDWGDGSALSEVTAFDDVDATHAYTAGTYQITITGTCGAFYMNNNSTNRGKLRKILQWGNMGFTGAGLQAAFYGCNNLTVLPEGSITGADAVTAFNATFRATGITTIPDGLFDNNTIVSSSAFINTFYACTNITSIPENLFRYNINVSDNGFNATFRGCTGLTSIPENLFRYNTNLTNFAFNATFQSCTGLTSIPEGLFRYNLGLGTSFFNSTFYACSNITSIPEDLFRYSTEVAVFAFANTFYNCSGLIYIPEGLFKYNTKASSTAFSSTFRGCTGLTSIPAGLFDSNVNVGVDGFNNTFNSCYNITNVPQLLFQHNVLATGFSGTFNECRKLKLNKYIFSTEESKSSRFLNRSVVFTSCFSRTSYTEDKGEAPELWQYNFGTGTPTKTSCFSGAGNSLNSLYNYCAIPNDWGSVTTSCGMLQELVVNKINSTSELLTIRISQETIPIEGTLNVYLSNTEIGLESPENIVVNTKASDYYYESTLLVGEGMFYVLVVYEQDATREELTYNKYHYSVEQKETTAINITSSSNYVTLSDPRHSYNHGLIYINGYIYGSARGGLSGDGANTGHSFFKIKEDDYSLLTQQKFFNQKNAELQAYNRFEQIVYCKGFLWCQTVSQTGVITLVRINLSDLDYMSFNVAGGSPSLYQPIGTDGIYLYVNNDTSVLKLNTDILLDSFVSYGYDGANAVNIPPGTILGSCAIIQRHPAIIAGVHSVNVDSRYVYLAVTVSSNLNGYDPDLDIYIYHFQKIDKVTMTTVGDVIIPKATDDMVQSNEYVFLAPEYENTALDLYGADWGLMAIRKSDLHIKYLKALHADFNTVNEVDRQCYGVQYFGQYILVQLVNSKKSIVVRTDKIDQWGADFPIGGATEKIYTFQINGTPLAAPSNELVLDSSGVFHANTWETNTIVYKFTETELEFNACPNVESYLIEHLVNSTTLGGFVLDTGGSAITETGFYYGKDPNNLSTQIISEDIELNFSASLSLSPGLYFFKAYATNEVGECYGATVPFIVGNTVILDKDNDDAIVSLESVNSGHAVRCCKPAPGIADGVTGTVTDVHGNIYATVVINEIEWMAEDLIVTRYADTSIIPNLVDSLAWSADETGALSAYNNNWENSCIEGTQDAVTTTTTE